MDELREKLLKLREDFPGRSPAQLLVAAADRGIDVTKAQLNEFLRDTPVEKAESILHKPMPWKGKSAAEGPQTRFQADLAVYDRPVDGFKGFLLLVDVFTREAWARPLRDKTAAGTVAAFKDIQKDIWGKESPEGVTLTTDGGLEFTGAFRRHVESEGIIWRQKPPGSTNDIAVLDRAMGAIKKDLKAAMLTNKNRLWPRYLQKVLTMYNETYNRSIHGAPKNVATNPTVHFLNLQDNARKIVHNDKNETSMQFQLANHFGRFRPPIVLKSGLAFNSRATSRRFGPTREAAYVTPGVVTDTRGKEHTLKRVLPVGQKAGPRRRV